VAATLRKLDKLRSLSGGQQRLLAIALLLLPVFWVTLRALGFQRFAERIDRTPASGKAPFVFEEITAIGALVNSATFHVLGPDNCLIRSLYLLWLLRRRGVSSSLRIGTRLTDGQLKAHAWVEVADQPVNDPHDIAENYVAFDQPLTSRLVAPK
jgi:hypothetical protein